MNIQNTADTALRTAQNAVDDHGIEAPAYARALAMAFRDSGAHEAAENWETVAGAAETLIREIKTQ